MTRTASLSSEGSPPERTTSTSTIEPSLLTTNWQITRPWIPFSCAITGYFTFSLRYLNNACCPPGNSGIFSTTTKITSSSSSSTGASTGAAITTSCSVSSVFTSIDSVSTLSSTTFSTSTSCTAGGGGGGGVSWVVCWISTSSSKRNSVSVTSYLVTSFSVHSSAT